MLQRLRGRRHQVITGVALTSSERAPRSRLATTEVWMRSYTDAEIEEYVASGDPFDKAGSYAIQHPTFRPVERIAGCFLNVVGLPLPEIVDLLGEAGIGSKVNRPALEAACPGCLEKEMLTGSS